MVGVEPVRGEEHGEEKDDVRFDLESGPETEELRLPAGILYEDDFAAVGSGKEVSIRWTVRGERSKMYLTTSLELMRHQARAAPSPVRTMKPTYAPSLTVPLDLVWMF